MASNQLMTHNLTAKELFDSAQSGQKLTAIQRRHVVAWLSATSETNYTNVDLGKIFGVNEKIIRGDKVKIREEMVKELAANKDVNFIISDIFMDFETQRRDLEKNKKHARLGSTTYTQCCNSIIEMRFKLVKTLQELGWLPKNLGSVTEQNIVNIAVMQDNNVVQYKEKDPDKINKIVKDVLHKKTEVIEGETISPGENVENHYKIQMGINKVE